MSTKSLDGKLIYPWLTHLYHQYTTMATALHVPTEQIIYRKRIREFKRVFRHFLLTSRFNNHTWSENSYFRQTHPTHGCVYCSPDPIASCIPPNAIMFILEMNNDTNRIMGVGMVRNHPVINRSLVYDNRNYNRYMFSGKTRIDRSDLTAEEERIFTVFDILCFTGNKHMKRGQGLKSFPADILFRCMQRLDILQFIVNMFKSRLQTNALPSHSSTSNNYTHPPLRS
jgi:hypothetical protein